jgi:uncharacterized protein (UPF0264 family)
MSGIDLARPDDRVRLLASVARWAEIDTACALGADLVDLKDPARGALGAWPLDAVPRAVELVGGRRRVSATVGDLPMEPSLLLGAARRMGKTGVDLVKVGFFGGGNHRACAEALAEAAATGVRLVAVMMADQRPALDLLPVLARAGFAGAMLDTADKTSGSLRRHLGPEALRAFVGQARALGLLTGLAGSLTADDIGPLAALRPHYLGFRGALCRGGRNAALDPRAFTIVRAALDAACHGTSA